MLQFWDCRVGHDLANEQQQQQQCTSQSNIFNFDEVQFMIFFLFIDYDFGVETVTLDLSLIFVQNMPFYLFAHYVLLLLYQDSRVEYLIQRSHGLQNLKLFAKWLFKKKFINI